MDKATIQHTCEPPLFRTKRPKVDKMSPSALVGEDKMICFNSFPTSQVSRHSFYTRKIPRHSTKNFQQMLCTEVVSNDSQFTYSGPI